MSRWSLRDRADEITLSCAFQAAVSVLSHPGVTNVQRIIRGLGERERGIIAPPFSELRGLAERRTPKPWQQVSSEGRSFPDGRRWSVAIKCVRPKALDLNTRVPLMPGLYPTPDGVDSL